MLELSERLKERLIALMEAGRLELATRRLPMLFDHGRSALEELKELIQLESKLKIALHLAELVKFRFKLDDVNFDSADWPEGTESNLGKISWENEKAIRETLSDLDGCDKSSYPKEE